ncbi:MAG: hypothetical protein ACRD1T_09335 [Acidimicrobiia bacterium]
MSQTIGGGITVKDEVLIGPVRAPVNPAARLNASIHNDEVAQKLGFRGGTIAGSIHMDQFPPLLVQAFGQKWFETGSLSLYFVNATLHRETVRAFLKQPEGNSDVQTQVWMDRDPEGDAATAGMKVAEGTASVGNPADQSELHRRDLRLSDPEELRIFRDVRAGDSLGDQKDSLSSNDQAMRIEKGQITEPLDWYTGRTPWGGPIAPPSAAISLLYRKPSRSFSRHAEGSVGLFGAIELRMVNGPVMLDTTYNLGGEIVGVGQSPKTEYVWYDSYANDETGKRVAGMRMLLRFMKASAKQYEDA